MKNIFIVTIFILGILNFKSNANETTAEQPIFQGQIKTEADASPIEKLVIKFYKPKALINEMSDISVIPDTNGHFRFKLPYYDKPSTILIFAVHKDRRQTNLDRYFVEPNDKIKILITSSPLKDNIVFSGSNSSKYNIVNELAVNAQRLNDLIADFQLHDPTNFQIKVQKLDSLLDDVLESKAKILTKYDLTFEMQKMIDYEYCNVFTIWDYCLYSISLNKSFQTDANRKMLRDYFNQRKKKYSYQLDDLMSFCPVHITNLSSRIRFDLILNSKSNNAELKEYYNMIKSTFSQALKDQLLGWLFSSRIGMFYIKADEKSLDSLMYDAENQIKNPNIKQTISNAIKLSIGRDLFNGTFKDLKGNLVTTSSLKGKVVLIDMWGVGCSNCAVFHKMFEAEVYPNLKENNDFILLSINTDKTREKWIEGLNSQYYTSDENLNVYTDGLMLNHRFAKYYNINYLPFLLLVDKNGKIYSQLKNPTPENVLKNIQSALQEN